MTKHGNKGKGQVKFDMENGNNVEDELKKNVHHRHAAKTSWCAWWMSTGPLKSCCGEGDRNNRMFMKAQKKLMTEIDVLEITKLLRLTRFWMTKNVSRRQREMTKYFDDYTLHSGGDEAEPPLPPGHPIEQPRQEQSDERIRDAKAGFLELKMQKHLTDYPSVEHQPYTPNQQKGLFEDLDYTYGSMDHWMVKSILPHV